MRRTKLSLIVSILFLLTACSGTKDQKINPGFQHFRITIEQDGIIKDIENHSVTLEKKPFTILVSFTGPDNIFVNASFNPESYNAAMNGLKVSDIPGFKDPGIDEVLFNKDEVLIISRTSPNFWNYASPDEHRFNDVTEKAGILLCRRNISNILFLEDSKKTFDIADLKEKELYLVFMKLEWNRDFSKKIEIKRDFVRILFKNTGIGKADLSGILNTPLSIETQKKEN